MGEWACESSGALCVVCTGVVCCVLLLFILWIMAHASLVVVLCKAEAQGYKVSQMLHQNLKFVLSKISKVNGDPIGHQLTFDFFFTFPRNRGFENYNVVR